MNKTQVKQFVTGYDEARTRGLTAEALYIAQTPYTVEDMAAAAVASGRLSKASAKATASVWRLWRQVGAANIQSIAAAITKAEGYDPKRGRNLLTAACRKVRDGQPVAAAVTAALQPTGRRATKPKPLSEKLAAWIERQRQAGATPAQLRKALSSALQSLETAPKAKPKAKATPKPKPKAKAA